jgi:thiol:disulfide interchange protein DsbD
LFALAVLCANPALAASGAPEGFAGAMSKGLIYGALVALGYGLLASLTPCVYPMIVITVSVFGAKKAGRLRAIALSGAFVAGIATMFTPLGVVAGLTGMVFGSVLQNTWVLVGISLLFLAMAASMFGAFEIALPSSLVQRLNQVGGMGLKGAFGLGLVCGLIAAPCTGPGLMGILTWISTTKDATFGAIVMLAFSLGLGLPFFVVGAAAMQLPKSGQWMLSVKSFLGLALAVVALYYMSSAFPALAHLARPDWRFLGICLALATVGVALGAVHRDFHSPDLKDRLLKGVGVVLAAGASFGFLAGWMTPERTLEWKTMSLTEAKMHASKTGQPLLIDFTASWCGACKELEKHTFASPDVAREAGRFLAVRVDASDDEDPSVQDMMKAVGVVGLPTVIVFDSRGKEAVRYTDFVPPERFLSSISEVN